MPVWLKRERHPVLVQDCWVGSVQKSTMYGLRPQLVNKTQQQGSNGWWPSGLVNTGNNHGFSLEHDQSTIHFGIVLAYSCPPSSKLLDVEPIQ